MHGLSSSSLLDSFQLLSDSVRRLLAMSLNKCPFLITCEECMMCTLCRDLDLVCIADWIDTPSVPEKWRVRFYGSRYPAMVFPSHETAMQYIERTPIHRRGYYIELCPLGEDGMPIRLPQTSSRVEYVRYTYNPEEFPFRHACQK